LVAVIKKCALYVLFKCQREAIRETRKSSISELERAPVPPRIAVLSGKRCLLLEDELLIALDIEQLLRASGAAIVVSFADADQAMAALRAGARFDVAILDVLLGSASRTSEDVAQALQLQKTPFVFLTGMRDASAQSKKFPAAPVVHKPFVPELLVAAVVRALERPEP
jgi:CheY-like chemotaxis protein